SFIVLKDPQVRDLLGHTDGDSRGIIAADAKQNHETDPDFSCDPTLHDYTRAAYTLDNGSHFPLRRICAVGPASLVCARRSLSCLLTIHTDMQPPRYKTFSSKSARRQPALCNSSRTTLFAHVRHVSWSGCSFSTDSQA